MHGGAQMCSVQGCQRVSGQGRRGGDSEKARLIHFLSCCLGEQRARFFGRCTMHGGYVNCKEEGCTLRAVGKGKCAKVSIDHRWDTW